MVTSDSRSGPVPLVHHFSQKPFFITDFAGFSSPHVLKLSMSGCWASTSEAGTACLFSAIDDPEPSFAALYMAHDFDDGMCEHFSECEMKLLNGGCFNVSLSYFVHFGVLAKHLNVLRKPGKQYATQLGWTWYLWTITAIPLPHRCVLVQAQSQGPKLKCPLGFHWILSLFGAFNFFNGGI